MGTASALDPRALQAGKGKLAGEFWDPETIWSSIGNTMADPQLVGFASGLAP